MVFETQGEGMSLSFGTLVLAVLLRIQDVPFFGTDALSEFRDKKVENWVLFTTKIFQSNGEFS